VQIDKNVEETAKDNKLVQELQNELQTLRETNEFFQSEIRTITREHGQQSAIQLSNLNSLKHENEQLRQEKQTQLEKVRLMQQRIKTVEYRKISNELAQRYLLKQSRSVHDMLKRCVVGSEDVNTAQLPQMHFRHERDEYVIELTGFDEHHKRWKQYLKQMSSLMQYIKSAKEYYHRHLRRQYQTSLVSIWRTINCRSWAWHRFISIFTQLAQQKSQEEQSKFELTIEKELEQTLLSECLQHETLPSWHTVKQWTDEFVQRNSNVNDIETIKRASVRQFIDDNLLNDRVKQVKDVRPQALQTLKQCVANTWQEFDKDTSYRGIEQKHFQMIVTLLQRIMIYFCSFVLQAPIFDESIELLKIIKDNVVTIIKTPTGSGNAHVLIFISKMNCGTFFDDQANQRCCHPC
jgi:hypothetical protein